MDQPNNKRLLLIGLAVLVGLYAIYKWPYTYYSESRADLEKQIETREKAIEKANYTIAKAQKLADWAPLNVDPALAESRMNNYVAEWIKRNGLAFGSVQQVRGQVDAKNPGFLVLASRFTATGGQKSIANLLWSLNKSPIPLRITEFTVRSKREGNDDLEISFGVSTICVDPKASKDPKNKTTGGAKT